MAIGQSVRQVLGAVPFGAIAKGMRWLVVAVAVAVAVAGAVAGWLVYSSLPVRSGTLDVDGLAAPVEIARDPRGVPHIFAGDMRDAVFALGFVHAQDRLWQMEAMRRFASGRLAEVVGPRALQSDRTMRILGFQNLVEAQYERLSDGARAQLARYAEGVNAWLLEHRGALPPEFQVLGMTPEPWRPTDSLLWVKMMALRLSGNFRDEIARARLVQQIGRERTDAFWYPDIAPAVGADAGPASVPDLGPRLADAMLDALGDLGAAPIGASNAWAVTGRFSGTGGAILANDPHLGFSAPGPWYLVRISTPGAVRVGATAPGVPFLVLGHNGHVAWGLTTTQTDQQDVYIERLGDDPSTYLTSAGFRSFERRREIIAVKGAEDVQLVVRSTERGPVISDILDEQDVAAVDQDGVLSLRAVFLDPADRTPEALYNMGRAETMTAFEQALSLVHAPQQNVLFAADTGEIGFVAAGAVPVRGAGRGRYPARGWAPDDQWTGYVPFQDLPRAINPPGNRVVTANNSIVGPDYPYFITDDWAPPYRARRIFDLMGNRPQSPDTTAEAQRDARSLMAVELTPFILAVEASSPRIRAAQVLLQGWPGDMIRRRPEPLIFYAWLRRLTRLIYADEFGPLFERFWDLKPRFILRVLTRDTIWCDDIGTEPRETCDDMVARALQESLAELTVKHESGIVRWRWGDDHRARFPHPLFTGVPVLNGWSDLSIDADGGNYTINRAAVRIRDAERPFDAVHGAGFRAIYDLADLNRSRFMIATGQSGHIFSDSYGNLIEDWRNGLYFRLDVPRAVLHGAEKTRTLTLIPTGLETRFRGPDAPDPEETKRPEPPKSPGPEEVPPAGPEPMPGVLPSPDPFTAPGPAPMAEPDPLAPLVPEIAAPEPGASSVEDLMTEPIVEGDPFGTVETPEPMPESMSAPMTEPMAEPLPEPMAEPAPEPAPGVPTDAGLFDLPGLSGEAPAAPEPVPEPLPEAEPLPGAVAPPSGQEPTPIDPSQVDQIEDSINDLMRSITESLDPVEQ